MDENVLLKECFLYKSRHMYFKRLLVSSADVKLLPGYCLIWPHLIMLVLYGTYTYLTPRIAMEKAVYIFINVAVFANAIFL